MKKLFSLLFFCGLFHIANAQVTTTVYATGATGSFTCGYDNNGLTRTDGSPTIRIGQASANRAYAVFDLSTIPASAIITSVVVGYNITTLTGAGGTSNTYGYAGDLSTVVSAATLWTNLASGTLLNSTYYGTAIGNYTLPTNAISQTFIASHIGSKISICFVQAGSTARNYYFTGETGSTTTTGAHAPFLTITYCSGIAGLAASAAPNPICAGNTLNLTGVGTSTSYHWYGPGGFTATGLTSTVPAITAGGAGVYTFVAVDASGCNDTARTASVTVNPLPAAIAGVVTPVCGQTNVTLSDVSGAGTWSVSPTSIATIGTTGIFVGTATSPGIATVTFTLSSTGCQITAPISVNPFPAPITGGPANDTLCIGSTVTLSDTTLGGAGAWSSFAPTIASITASGVVTPLSAGTTIIEYLNTATGCGPAKYTLTIGATPSLITGISRICVASVDTLLDSIAGGVWTSSSPFIGTISPFAGWLTGYNAGNVTITYTLPSHCYKTFPVLVTSAPGPIINMRTACPGDTIQITDTMQYGTWSSSNPAIASIAALSSDSVVAVVTAITAGKTEIKYFSCGYYITDTFVVSPIPKPIMGRDSVCVGDTVMLYDSSAVGIWVSSNSAISTAAAAFGIITGIAPGYDTIMYKLPTGCFTKMRFYVEALPAPIVGLSAVCVGSIITLSDVSTGGKWYSKHINIAKTDSINGYITGILAGLDTIVYKSGLGCKITTPITVNPLPAPIIGDTTICSTDSMIMIDVSPNGVWSCANTSVFTIDSTTGMLNTVSTTKDSAYIYYTLPTGCTTKIKIVRYPSPIPIVGYNGAIGEDSVVNIGYYDASLVWHNNFVSYQWYDSSTVGLMVGATTNHVAIVYNEIYYVVVTDTLGCVGRSALYFSYWAAVNNVSMDKKIIIYPNPVENVLHIISPINVNCIISSIEGKKILEQKNDTNFDLKNLASGPYLISIFDEKDNLIKTEQFIKE